MEEQNTIDSEIPIAVDESYIIDNGFCTSSDEFYIDGDDDDDNNNDKLFITETETENKKIKVEKCNIDSIERNNIRRRRERSRSVSVNDFGCFETKNMICIVYTNSTGHIIDSQNQHLNLNFDKNLNLLTHCNISKYKQYPNSIKIPDVLYNYINKSIPVDIDLDKVDKFLLINAERFFKSHGQDFRIIYKYNLSYREILNIKKTYVNEYKIMLKTNEKLKEITKSVYDEDHFDILYNLAHYNNSSLDLTFVIILKYDDVVIKNSIDLEKYLGTMFIYLFCAIEEGEMLIHRNVRGSRSTYNKIDLYSNYVHSHLSSGSGTNLNNFCLGNENHPLSHLSNAHSTNFQSSYEISELEYELVLIGFDEYIRWESLEGGPHCKMEDISLFKNYPTTMNLHSNTPSEIDNTSYLYKTNRERLIHTILSNKDFIKNHFNLIKKGTGFEFSYDKSSFLEGIGHMLKNNNNDNDYKYIYNKSGNNVINSESSNSAEIVKDLNEKTRIKLSSYIPSYINTKIIYPSLIESTEEEDLLNNIIFIPHPVELLRIANIITSLLNKELKKNEYRKS